MCNSHREMDGLLAVGGGSFLGFHESSTRGSTVRRHLTFKPWDSFSFKCREDAMCVTDWLHPRAPVKHRDQCICRPILGSSEEGVGAELLLQAGRPRDLPVSGGDRCPF